MYVINYVGSTEIILFKLYKESPISIFIGIFL